MSIINLHDPLGNPCNPRNGGRTERGNKPPAEGKVSSQQIQNLVAGFFRAKRTSVVVVVVVQLEHVFVLWF